MKQNTNIVWGVIGLIIIAAVIYFYPGIQNILQRNAKVEAPQGNEKKSLIMQGKITGVYPDTMKIAISSVSLAGAPKQTPTGVEKTVTIDSATKIEKIISQKNSSGVLEKQVLAEVNIGDVPKGDLATIEYQLEEGSVLGGVSRVVFTVDGNVDAYMKQVPQMGTIAYVKSEVVSVDLGGKSLQHKPYLFNAVGATTMSIAIPDGISVYRVDDPIRVSIIHAREAATLADVKPGQVIFFMIYAKMLREGKSIPQAFIISGK